MAALKRSALGRGLDALITMDDLKTGGSSSISEIELSKIQPNPEQPRSIFEEETLEELATSIRSLGVIQPITLKEIGPEQYMIISGERRYRASLKAGLERIPAYIKTAADENVEEMVRNIAEGIQPELPEKKKSDRKPILPEEFKLLKDHLSRYFNTKVQLTCNEKGKGKITIPFATEEELEQLIGLLDKLK